MLANRASILGFGKAQRILDLRRWQLGDSSLPSLRRTVWFAGRVQGVGFRATTVRIAKRYPVSGYVENLPDGRVRLVVEGERVSLEQFLAELRVSLPVSKLAKWKTTLQMVALGSLILAPAVPGWVVPFTGGAITPERLGITTLWLAAALTLITGWDYLRVGLKHMD